MKKDPQIIVALDVTDKEAALHLVDMLGGEALWFKVGPPLFTVAGPSILEQLHKRGKRIFLDFKLHDIPATVHRSIGAMMHQGVDMITVHASGGDEMLRQAVDASMDRDPSPYVVAVTVLTSQASADGLEQRVHELALSAKRCGLSGVVCSPHEVSMIKETCGEHFITVVPGIRPANAQANDQKRIATPAQAVKQGADFLVIGRPIIWASDPKSAFQSILQEIQDIA